ncbi:hypothetical protein HK101_000442 [Irineochytrium annulatum]|nr:hypothetical protein HK101_000442 [Irineochytrium annulatum]
MQAPHTHATHFLPNASPQNPPFRFVDTTSAASIATVFDPLADQGWNMVRLPFNWEALEPTQGTYDLSYLSYYRDVVRALEQRGIYTLVDFHQDGFSRWDLGGCGEGFPQWTVPASSRVTPANQSDAVDVNRKFCNLWGAVELIEGFVGGKDDAAWKGFLDPTSAVNKGFLKMVNTVSSYLAGETGIAGFDLVNEPYKMNTAFLEAEAQIIMSSGWPNVTFYVEPYFDQGNFTRPNIQNLVYSPHYYDKRIIVDPLYAQLKFWLQDDHSFKPLTDAFFASPSVTTWAAVMAPITKVIDSISSLADTLSSQPNAGSVTNTMRSGVSNANSRASDINNTVHGLLTSPVPFSWIETAVAGLVIAGVDVVKALLSGLLFTPVVGVFPILHDILGNIQGSSLSTVQSYVQVAKTAGKGAPVFVGEVGCPGEAMYMPAQAAMSDFMQSADSLFMGYAQWNYNPLWTEALKDGWNGEDLSIVSSLSPVTPRSGFVQHRPFPRAVAGTPQSLSISPPSKSPQTLALSYVTGPVGGKTEIWFSESGSCGGKAAKITTTGPVSCAYNAGSSTVDCVNSAASAKATVNVSC